MVNYAATPFMLLNVKDSLMAWRNLEWYGFYIIFGALAFFYAGGSSWLKSMHKKPDVKKEVRVEDSGNESTASESYVTSPPSFHKVIPPPKF
jgi:lysophospholipid acyltransferase